MPDSSRLERQLRFVIEMDRLKAVLRRNGLIDGSRLENDAEHSWHLALMATLLAEYADEPVDVGRVVTMLLIHDVVEIDAGDTFLYDEAGVADQEQRERVAADRIFALLPDDQAMWLRQLWDEFELRQSPDARFARAMDRLQPLLLNHYGGGGTWAEPGVTASKVRERKGVIADASQPLWDAARALIADGVNRGILREG